MKRLAVVVAIAILGLTSQMVIAESLSPLEIYGSIAVGGLLSGFQKDLPDQTLIPVPDSYGTFAGLVGCRVFFIEQVGIEVMGGLGRTSAESSNVSNPLALYDYTLASVGVVLRYNLSPRPRGWISLLAGGGVSYTNTTINSAFNNLVGPFLSTESDYGWYAKGGAAYYFGPHFFLDLTLYYYSMNSKFVPSGKNLNGAYFLAAFSFGAALL